MHIGEEFSELKPLKRGVPQRSVLGPVLFSVYTADLSVVLQRYGVKFKLFADDTQFYISVTNICSAKKKLSVVLLKVKQWMDSRQLKLNENKSECLFVGRKLDLERLNVQTLRVKPLTL